MIKKENFSILDCTIRDGGYYTNWDFDPQLIEDYLESFNNLPVDYLEIGYRSLPQEDYFGEYFYCPDYLLDKIRYISKKKLSVMINEKSVSVDDVDKILNSAVGKVDIVRIAVDPKNINRATKLAKKIKSLGFEVGFNVMYMSTWKDLPDFIENLGMVNGVIDYFYMVDSYGGVYPQDVVEACAIVKEHVHVPIGFHGHNNLEMALINSIAAIENGASLIDCTITGMGRGAGNLKTELLLSALNAGESVDFDFNALSKVVDGFTKLQEEYKWGTNLAYMVSGANSLPQKDVMDWLGKRFYSLNSIIRALSNQSHGKKDNIELANFNPKEKSTKILIIGGGNSATKHSMALLEYLNKNEDILIIHVSSRNIMAFKDLENTQIHCLSGNEGHRLESNFSDIDISNRIAVLPPYPRVMGTYIPAKFIAKSYQLSNISFTNEYKDSVTAVAIQAAIDLGAEIIEFAGYDGYSGTITTQQIELFQENKILFTRLKVLPIKFQSLTPTKYEELKVNSIYSLI